jgi:hypothetical protein
LVLLDAIVMVFGLVLVVDGRLEMGVCFV